MSKDIHFKVDDEIYKEWVAIGNVWHGIRSKLMRRKVREVLDEIKKNPVYCIPEQKERGEK